MADDVLKDSIDVTVNNETYTFRIPSYLDEIKIGVRQRDIVRSVSPDAGIDGVDGQTYFLINTAARFEVLLQSASVKWPYSNGPSGEPVVDFQKWPKDKVTEALAVGAVFSTELSSFRQRGFTDNNPAGEKAVESEPVSQ
jgi:hypothetical protein